MSTSLADLAALVNGRLNGVGDQLITGAAILADAGPGEITMADHPDRLPQLRQSIAAAAIVPADVICSHIATITVDDVHTAFTKIVLHFRPPHLNERVGISEGAWISPSAQLSEGVEIYPGATIGESVIVGRGTTIHSGVRILAGCIIGSDATLFPNVVLYENTHIGNRVLIHAGAVLGAHGFGYRQVDGKHQLAAQLGNVEIGDDVEIGACATVDRGTYGPTLVGEGTKIDNFVQIAHNCRIGKHNLICGQVGIAGSSSTGDYVVMAGQVGVRDHVHIGEGAVLCSKAGVSNHVGDGEVMLGQPATQLRKQKLQMAAISKLPEMRREFRALQRQFQQLQQQLDTGAEGTQNSVEAA